MEITLRQPYSFWQRGQRDNQEDARFPDVDAPQDKKPAFVVCDGVGGQDKGEVASRTVADAIGRAMQDMDLTRRFTDEDFVRVLDSAWRALERRMASVSREMATTMTFLCFHGGGAFVAHIGDSRIYHVRPGVGILYQSEDHSLVNALVHSGNLTPEEAVDHPQSNIITRCMGYVPAGAERPTATTLRITDIEPGDCFFLCSDGVLHCVDDAMLLRILSDASMAERDKIGLIASLSKDSSDNNTAYLVVVDSVESDASDRVCKEPADEERVSVTRPIDCPVEQSKEIGQAAKSPIGRIRKFLSDLFG